MTKLRTRFFAKRAQSRLFCFGERGEETSNPLFRGGQGGERGAGGWSSYLTTQNVLRNDLNFPIDKILRKRGSG
jgi:hypothetical protein